MKNLSKYVNEQVGDINKFKDSDLGKVLDIIDSFDKVHEIWSEVTNKVSPQGETIGKLLDRAKDYSDQIIELLFSVKDEVGTTINLDIDLIKNKKLVTVIRSFYEWKELKILNAKLKSMGKYSNMSLNILIIALYKTIDEFIINIE